MNVGLYSITFLGVWYRGPALTLEQLIERTREYGYTGIEVDGKRPHGNPLDLPTNRCLEVRKRADAAGVDIYAVAANNDYSSQDVDGHVRGYVRRSDGGLTAEDFYADFVSGLLEIGYEGYIGYELCHSLPKVDGRTVGIEFAEQNARLAAEYMRAVIADLQQTAGAREVVSRAE
ncbi:MAG: hypothetical protein ACRD1S_17990 [Vicinamibacterales bacterium]